MDLMKRVSYVAATLAVSGLLAGCFSYHRDVTHTSTPEVNPPAASSSTTTTTSNDNGNVERHSTTTYSNTP
ncbi:MAG TPA: hypothetical protein VJ728_03205 [Candidatus Binataceae bacterium]|nr:hypothetical protein [Candidatus Binataceae bacterium]